MVSGHARTEQIASRKGSSPAENDCKNRLSMDCYLEDHIENYLIPKARTGLDLLEREGDNPRTPENTIVTTSGGLSVTVIPLDQSRAVQVYASKELYQRIKAFCLRFTTDVPSPTRYLTLPLEYHDEELAISFEKIEPLNCFGADIEAVYRYAAEHIEAIRSDISKALKFLHENRMQHGDPRLDNIGYCPDRECYVLFDYDKAGINITNYDMDADCGILDSSLEAALRSQHP